MGKDNQRIEVDEVLNDKMWTNEQLDAIASENGNILVAAAAGSGKTAVLVERIIRKITDPENPVDIDRLLIVTFTKAAASEMRERIADAVLALMDKNVDSAFIQRQLSLLAKANITTMHTFCADVIKSNLHEIDIDPDFKVGDDAECLLLKIEALNELLEEQYENDSEEFFALLECYGENRGDQKIQELILDIYDFIQSCPWPSEWLHEKVEELNFTDNIDFANTKWGKIILDLARLELESAKQQIAKAIEIIEYGMGLDKYKKIFKEDMVNIDSLIRIITEENNNVCESKWDRIYNALNDMKFSKLPILKGEVDEEKKSFVTKVLREKVKNCINKRLKEKFFACDSSTIIDELKSVYPVIKYLSTLVIDFSNKYAQKKKARSIVDFNDLEHLCLEILTERDQIGQFKPSKTAYLYKERFCEILFDEYQDSNLVQELIIRMISRTDQGKPNVFMVGDVKQSIYRFRKAKPELFLEKYRTYLLEKDEMFRKILLFKNFRSRKEVVDAVNFIFKQIMSVHVGELDYTANEELNPGAVFNECSFNNAVYGGTAEFHIIKTEKNETEELEKSENCCERGNNKDKVCDEEFLDISGSDSKVLEELEQDEEFLDDISCEARFAAKRILNLVNPSIDGKNYYIFDKSIKQYRKVEYRDIVILLRTTKNWAQIFVDEFAKQGIPAFADAGTGFFKTVEVQVILSLLKIIDNPFQDIPLISVLRSPIFCFTSDDLVQIRLTDKNVSYYDALKKFVLDGEGELKHKVQRFMEKLNRWREMSLYTPTDKLIWYLYDETRYYDIVGAMPGGQQRQANLKILFERARKFENTSYKGLFNFINFVERFKSSQGDLSSAKILSENDNVVRIMSIHKSKGLEFPVVLLAGCGKKFNFQDMNRKILLHEELGFGPDIVDHKRRIYWSSAAKEAIKQKIKSETLSEEMRILYVALTRAREKLIITGTVKNFESSTKKWLNMSECKDDKLPDFELVKAANYMDWLVPALLRHKNSCELEKYLPSGGIERLCYLDDPSLWEIKVWNREDAIVGNAETDSVEEVDIIKWFDELENDVQNVKNKSNDSEISEELTFDQDELIKRLNWSYPFIKASYIPAKISVTDLKKGIKFEVSGIGHEISSGKLYQISNISNKITEITNEISSELGVFEGEFAQCKGNAVKRNLLKRPKFLDKKKGLTPAEKGTIMHFIMQNIDFRNPDVKLQVENMMMKDLISKEQIENIDIGKIEKFFETEIGKRLLASSCVKREIPFNLEIPVNEIFSEFYGEHILLQGVIDCYFEEEDGIVLLDYKSDYVTAENIDIIKERYRPQVTYYAMALERLTGKTVKEKCIYLFWNAQVLNY